MITHRPSPIAHGRVCVWMSHGACERESVCPWGVRSSCGVYVCTDALTLVGVCSQAPGRGRNTNVTPSPVPRRHLCNRCTYHKPCVTLVNAVVSERYTCVCFSRLFFDVWGFLFVCCLFNALCVLFLICPFLLPPPFYET